jgi:hypothetical protein
MPSVAGWQPPGFVIEQFMLQMKATSYLNAVLGLRWFGCLVAEPRGQRNRHGWICCSLAAICYGLFLFGPSVVFKLPCSEYNQMIHTAAWQPLPSQTQSRLLQLAV